MLIISGVERVRQKEDWLQDSLAHREKVNLNSKPRNKRAGGDSLFLL